MADPNFTRVNLILHGKMQSHGAELLEQIGRISRACRDERAENYTLKNMRIAEHLTYDVLLDARGGLVSSCGIYHSQRFPAGVYRCLNRVFVHPDYRVKHGVYPCYATRYLLRSQLAEHLRDDDVVFVSREKPKARHFFNSWRGLLPEMQWHIPAQMIQVVPGVEAAATYQSIALRNGHWGGWSPNRLTDAEWESRFVQRDKTPIRSWANTEPSTR